MKKVFYKKIFAIAALATLAIVFLPIGGPSLSSPTIAPQKQGHFLSLSSFSPKLNLAEATTGTAANPPPTTKNNPISCQSGAVTCAVYYVAYFVDKVISWFIELGAGFAAAILTLNSSIYNSPTVQTGFSVTLAFANLGFVLALIVIAIATILRSQTYGFKQLLWKVIVMAILINFGLVVTLPIAALSDSVSGYFINQMGGNPAAMVTQITNAFAPQILTGLPASTGAKVAGTGLGVASAAGCATLALTTTPVGGLVCLIAVGVIAPYFTNIGTTLTGGEFNDATLAIMIGMVLSMVFLAILAFTFLALAVLLIIRYVYLTILLIILPLAWLAWVFPNTKSHFSKWWSLFLRWTFFPAISLFFIYLALLIVAPGTGTNGYFKNAIGSNGLAGTQLGVSSQTDAQALGTQLIIQVVFCGLVLGGLFAANSLGIAGAGAAMGMVKSTGNWVADKAKKGARGTAGYAGRRAQQAATAPLRSEKLRNVAARWQQPGKDSTLVKRWAGRLMAGGAAAGGEQTIAKGKEAIKNDSAELNRQKISTTANAWTRIARIGKAADDKQVASMSKEEQEQYFGKGKEAMFKRYGPEGEKIYRKARDESGIEERDLADEHATAMREFETSGGSAAAATKVDEIEAKQLALHKRLAETNPEALTATFQSNTDREKAVGKFKGKPLPAALTMDQKTLQNMQESIIRSMAKGFSPANASGLISALSKKNNLNEFQSAVEAMKRDDPREFQKLRTALQTSNLTLLKWFEQNPGKGLIRHRELFNLSESDIPEGAKPPRKTVRQRQPVRLPTPQPPTNQGGDGI